MVTIVQKEAPILREQARAVSLKDIDSPALKKILADMKTALEREQDGVAIAAPQIGVPLQIFVVSHRAFEYQHEPTEEDPETARNKKIPRKPKYEDAVFINPEIVKASRKKSWMHEGCLSVRWLYGKVSRFEKATVCAYDENGKLFTRGGSGLLAQIFQHEIDHLKGTLFIDKARDVEVITQEEMERQRKENEAQEHD